MLFDLRALGYFVAAFEERSITAAARRCFVAQPSISMAIKGLEEALETARAICANAPLSIRHVKQAVNGGLQTDLKSGLKLELAAYDAVYVSRDRREGVRAFNEKRKAEFRGI